jgi:hypothetical protein
LRTSDGKLNGLEEFSLLIMAADIEKMIANLLEFYDFKNHIVISIGAGGGQFIEYGRISKHVFAIDNNEEALNKLKTSLRKLQLSEKFTLINSDFYLVDKHGDVVMFEFCLHEMRYTESAIRHGLSLASEVLIIDHWPDSKWAYIVDEKEKVFKSWEAIKQFNVKKIKRFDTVQFFHDYEEIFQKIKVQGGNSISRISQFKDRKDFTIPMSYGLALI